MKLEGIHHITAVTGDARRNLDFYTRVLGLRLVKKTVNQDVPSIYHLFYGDELGEPGAGLAFFEYPGIQVGRAGAGMIHRISLASRVGAGAWLLGSPPARRGPGARAHRYAASLPRSGGSGSRAGGDRDRRRAPVGLPSRYPRRSRSAGPRLRARLRARPRTQSPTTGRNARLRAQERCRLGGAGRGTRRCFRLRQRSRRVRHSGLRHGASRRLDFADR